MVPDLTPEIRLLHDIDNWMRFTGWVLAKQAFKGVPAKPVLLPPLPGAEHAEQAEPKAVVTAAKLIDFQERAARIRAAQLAAAAESEEA